MRKIVKENLPIKPFILPRAEAVKLMEERKENYKIDVYKRQVLAQSCCPLPSF